MPEKTAFYLYDNFAEKLLIYTITDDVCELWDIQEIKGFMALLFDDDLAIGTNGVKSRYLLRDMQTGFDCYFGDTKYSAEFCEKVGLAMSSPVINRSLKRIAYFSPFGEAYEIMDYSHPHAIKSVFHKIYEGVIYVDASNDVLSIETKEGFNGATGSDDNIFVLCDELTIAERGLSSLANNICVLDWGGNYIKRLVYDKAMSCVCFDEEKSELFAVILDDDALYRVVSFPVEEILN